MKRGKEALDEILANGRRGTPRIRVAPKEERTVDGILFASKAEARWYGILKAHVQNCSIRFFLRQVPIHLPGGVKYVADFVVFENDGRVVFQDVKGHKTEQYKLKKRLVEALYPIKITEIR